MEFKLKVFLKEATVMLATLALAGCVAGSAKEVIATDRAPAAIGPYSQAIKFDNMLFLSGQIAIDPKTNQFSAGSIEEQTKQVLENLKAILAASGMTMENVVSTTVFLMDMNDFTKMNAVYGACFKEKPPARVTIQVAGLPRGALVEISAIAAR